MNVLLSNFPPRIVPGYVGLLMSKEEARIIFSSLLLIGAVTNPALSATASDAVDMNQRKDDALQLEQQYLTGGVGSSPQNMTMIRERYAATCSLNDFRRLAGILASTHSTEIATSAFVLIQTVLESNSSLSREDLAEALLDSVSAVSVESLGDPQLQNINHLLNLLSRIDNLTAYEGIIEVASNLAVSGYDSAALALLNYARRFGNDDGQDLFLADVQSSDPIRIIVSALALTSTADLEALRALDEEFKIKESAFGAAPKSELERAALRVLEMARNEIRQKIGKEALQLDIANSAPSEVYSEHLTGFVADPDYSLALRFAPELRLSSEGVGGGVNLYEPGIYQFTDYIPFGIQDLDSHNSRKVGFTLTETAYIGDAQYEPGEYLIKKGYFTPFLATAGGDGWNSESNSFDFSDLWVSEPLLFEGEEAARGFKELEINPTVYYRVFREADAEWLGDNLPAYPVAIQYWFFYFYNDWAGNHPGDFETITIFLDSDKRPRETVYSTHYEANRRDWDKSMKSSMSCEGVDSLHPVVFVSNGGHGSYQWSGNTYYVTLGDNHLGDKESLGPFRCNKKDAWTAQFALIDLSRYQKNRRSAFWFKGKWGDAEDGPPGIQYRTDYPTGYSFKPKNPPRDPFQDCNIRHDARIYGDPDMTGMHGGPWHWASGYGLNGAACVSEAGDGF